MSTPDTEIIRILGASPEQEGTGVPFQPRPAPKALPASLPILGLSDIVIFPGMVAPLLVDTAQSIRLIDDVVEGDRLLVGLDGAAVVPDLELDEAAGAADTQRRAGVGCTEACVLEQGREHRARVLGVG